MNYEQELYEAVNAGEAALVSLKQAQKYLNSASGWGVVDIIGGGFFTNLIKHSKLDNANYYMEQARTDLMRFKQELDDVDDYIPNFDVGGFMSFADFFFDGFVVDVLMQSKISNAKKQVQQAISQVESILERLRYAGGNPIFV
ncbi:MAG: hypothetical protein MJ105_04720 [Lachnospiraceae bacterium]|nr:hypothetical protein [Lachnospiraceae bacterium]